MHHKRPQDRQVKTQVTLQADTLVLQTAPPLGLVAQASTARTTVTRMDPSGALQALAFGRKCRTPRTRGLA